MPRIIRINKDKELETNCSCGAVVGYYNSDVRYYDGYIIGVNYIKCPNCTKDIILT